MKLQKLVAELRRRRVFRVAVGYLLAAWAVIQVATTVFPVLELPAWAAQLVVVAAIMGLPVALTLAWRFDFTAGRLQRTPPRGEEAAAPIGGGGGGLGLRRVLPVAAVLVTLLAASGGWYVVKRQTAVRAEDLDPRTVAVLPFRVAGADASLGYLREGMVDLLAVKLTGARRAVDPRTALAAWRSEAGEEADPPLAVAKRVAARLRARTMLVGSVVGSGEGITLNASLIDVPSGRELASGSEAGGADELPELVDRLVATVLSLEAGESEERLAVLTSTSLPALRAYLDGNAHYRRAQYRQAVASYARALELDSTFALAALNVIDPAGMELDLPGNWERRGRQLLLANRDRLTPRDRAFVDARWPVQPTTSIAARLERLERVAQQFPDRPEAWYHFADELYHNGALVGDGVHLERARAGFDRALALDSTYYVVLQHLLSVADRAGDTAFVFRFGERYLAAEPVGGFAYEHRLRAAHWRGDTVALQRMQASLDTVGVDILVGTIVNHQLDPRPLYRLDFARRAAELLARRTTDAGERNNGLAYRYQIEMNAGRPHDAYVMLDSVPPTDPLAWDRRRIYDAVYWDGDSAAAAASAQRVEQHLRRVPRGPLTDLDATALCAVTTLRLARGHTDGADAAIERLRVAHPTSTSPLGRRICALKLAAVLSHLEDAPDAEARLLELDSVMRTGPLAAGFREQGNITAARLFEARGDVRRALAASRRRLLDAGGQSYVSTMFELECRLAAAAGDRDAAIQACRRYLALRSDPEPRLGEKAAQAPAELARLGADRP
jgi:serine/threonine-protein kinase